MDDAVVEICAALLELKEVSAPEFKRLCESKSCSVSEVADGLWEADATYPVLLDYNADRPIVLCPFCGVEEFPDEVRREELAAGFAETVTLVSARLGAAAFSGKWGPSSWAYSVWKGENVLVSVEEANYEDERIPFLVIACVDRAADRIEHVASGLTASLFPADAL